MCKGAQHTQKKAKITSQFWIGSDTGFPLKAVLPFLNKPLPINRLAQLPTKATEQPLQSQSPQGLAGGSILINREKTVFYGEAKDCE